MDGGCPYRALNPDIALDHGIRRNILTHLGLKKASADLTVRLRFFQAYLHQALATRCSWSNAISGLKREGCENQPRSRRCNPDLFVFFADKVFLAFQSHWPLLADGKTAKKQESQKTCLYP